MKHRERWKIIVFYSAVWLFCLGLIITGCGGDTTPPQVSGTFPADGATDVPLNSALTITFNEAFDPSLAFHDDAVDYLYVAFEENTDGWPHIFVKRKQLAP